MNRASKGSCLRATATVFPWCWDSRLGRGVTCVLAASQLTENLASPGARAKPTLSFTDSSMRHWLTVRHMVITLNISLIHRRKREERVPQYCISLRVIIICVQGSKRLEAWERNACIASRKTPSPQSDPAHDSAPAPLSRILSGPLSPFLIHDWSVLIL